MTTLLNSIQEISIRILIQLFILDGEEKTSDYISSMDYLSLYSKTFKLNEYDLHGKKPYRLGELSSRLSLGKDSLKSLVKMGLCSVRHTNDGFVYSISESGKKVVRTLNSSYVDEYINFAIDAQEYFKNHTEIEVLKYINGISRSERR
ncbi:MAG: hypothetical protein Q4E02_05570 [Lagierella massiliensis]|nr:hypothetical protein [Lagierella massiliensis]